MVYIRATLESRGKVATVIVKVSSEVKYIIELC